MQHRSEWAALMTLAAIAPLAAAGKGKKSAPVPADTVGRNRPNIVFVLTDDLGIGDVGAYGQRTIPTPNIDSLARAGMQFMQHYAGTTVSAPSRAVLLTGKHTGHAGIRGNGERTLEDGTVYDYSLPAEEVTVAEILRSKGYTTGITGKWGLGGYPEEGGVGNQGFDYFFGHQAQLDAHHYYPKKLYENGTKIELDGTQYSDELTTQRALAFIDRSVASGRPFFLEFATTLPHAELVLPEEERKPFEGRFLETPFEGNWYGAQSQPRAAFAAMVKRIDDNVGRLVAKLRETGQLENTIFIFSSDNGTHVEGGHDPNYFNSNSLYRGTKRDLYEGGIRTPFIVVWPGQIEPGSVSYHVSAFWDFLPTVCEIVGADVPRGVDGISMLPEWTGRGEQPKHDYLYFEFHEEGGKQAVIRDNWKLIRLDAKQLSKDRSKVRYELYNLSRDPKELRNVAAEFPGKVVELQAIMDGARTESRNPAWNF